MDTAEHALCIYVAENRHRPAMYCNGEDMLEGCSQYSRRLFAVLVQQHDQILTFASLRRHQYFRDLNPGNLNVELKKLKSELEDFVDDRNIVSTMVEELGKDKWKLTVKQGDKPLLILKKPGRSEITLWLPKDDCDVFVDIHQEIEHNLPADVTSFVGREKEMAEVRKLLSKPETRLLTLIGSGGCGKTRLAVKVAAGLLEDYPDGVRLVELAGLTASDPDSDLKQVAQTVRSVLELREDSKSALETLTRHLPSKTLLLVLDNCEHLTVACAKLASTLLSACPKVKYSGDESPSFEGVWREFLACSLALASRPAVIAARGEGTALDPGRIRGGATLYQTRAVAVGL